METRHAMIDYKNEGRHEIIHVRTVKETIEAIQQHPKSDLLFLDHDLGGIDPDEAYLQKPGSKGTGSEVADLMIEMSEEVLPKKIILHTHNNAGAQYMYEVLRGTNIPIEWRPFGNDLEDVLSGSNIISFS
jgi:hypothetical protein